MFYKFKLSIGDQFKLSITLVTNISKIAPIRTIGQARLLPMSAVVALAIAGLDGEAGQRRRRLRTLAWGPAEQVLAAELTVDVGRGYTRFGLAQSGPKLFDVHN